MKHKMIGCSDECLRSPCCDFCSYSYHEIHSIEGVDGKQIIAHGGPIRCGLHDDERHQEIADGCGCCPDFHCFRADEDNMVVKEIDDDELA